jgi:hypothetical protein
MEAALVLPCFYVYLCNAFEDASRVSMSEKGHDDSAGRPRRFSRQIASVQPTKGVRSAGEKMKDER